VKRNDDIVSEDRVMRAVTKTMDTRGGQSRMTSSDQIHGSGSTLMVGGCGTTYAVAGTSVAPRGPSSAVDCRPPVKLDSSGSVVDADVWNPRASMAWDSAKGLLNPVGENNCFLNSAVQV